MNIKQLITDAEFLYLHQHYYGALALSMVVIGASSRKTYPSGTASIATPPGRMNDKEAFQTFLTDNWKGLKPKLEVDGKGYSMAEILYKFYRCNIVHEGALPPEFSFTDQGDESLTITTGGGSPFTINKVWIKALLHTAKSADCNRADFGIKKYELKLTGIDFDPSKHLVDGGIGSSSKKLKPDFIEHIKELILLPIGPDKLRGIDQQTMSDLINEGINESIIPGIAPALYWNNIIDNKNNLTDQGFSLISDLANHYEKVEV
ncbi:hypothetical protein SAMN05428975_1187 [Mucilaginibacter sp. OK268]|uniref:hypothetical protein n=1 Tax=Mucilaginibacter sp. OK268 TaxID=1881048 RepID=UPI000887C0AD|nr:hypothetical protein [Mucilaginibacter sp. OK268]SDP33359.1 hypothetical protein SAMN05428975_1187 [Mucilaginibacter sp. OK268]